MTGPNLGLELADGSRWVIRALDEQAKTTVRELGKVMRLSPAWTGGRLCAVSGRKEIRRGQVPAGRNLTCRLGPARGRNAAVLRMERIAAAMAGQSLARGGLLLHGALAVRNGAGFMLAGPSGIGKSTASRRLPASWESLSDDCTLVVRDPSGLCWAHPWPTWSRLRDNGPFATWPVEQAVPLKALLFLRQSPFDRAEPVAATPATALIMESAVQLARTVAVTPDGDANRAICGAYLRAAWALAAAVPAFRLHISLSGQFWDEIERAVEIGPRMDSCGHQIKQNSEWRQGGATRARRRRSVPGPPRRLLSGSPKPSLVRFRTGNRTFLKLVKGQRVVGSANDLLNEWCTPRPSRRSVRRRTTARIPTGLERPS